MRLRAPRPAPIQGPAPRTRRTRAEVDATPVDPAITRNKAGGFKRKETDAYFAEIRENSHIQVTCHLEGCMWPGFSGTFQEAREAAREHRVEAHPGLVVSVRRPRGGYRL